MTNEEKQNLISNLITLNIKLNEKQIREFLKYGTVVININKSKKKKLDKLLNDYHNIKISEFDQNMWRLTDIDAFNKLDAIDKGKLFQEFD